MSDSTPQDASQGDKKMIADSYNAIAPKYFSWSSPRPTLDRAEYIAALGHLIPHGSKVIELGCGAGVPATQQLVNLGLDVWASDVSSGLIDIARREVPGAKFEVMDMLGYVTGQLGYLAHNQDYIRPQAIMAFYTVWHLPPSEQSLLIQRAVDLLAPGGWLILNMMTVDGEMKMDEWMGAPMISWGLGADGNRQIFKGLVDKGILLSPPPADEGACKDGDISTGWEGVVKKEKVGRQESEMHWFCIQKSQSAK